MLTLDHPQGRLRAVDDNRCGREVRSGLPGPSRAVAVASRKGEDDDVEVASGEDPVEGVAPSKIGRCDFDLEIVYYDELHARRSHAPERRRHYQGHLFCRLELERKVIRA